MAKPLSEMVVDVMKQVTEGEGRRFVSILGDSDDIGCAAWDDAEEDDYGCRVVIDQGRKTLTLVSASVFTFAGALALVRDAKAPEFEYDIQLHIPIRPPSTESSYFRLPDMYSFLNMAPFAYAFWTCPADGLLKQVPKRPNVQLVALATELFDGIPAPVSDAPGSAGEDDTIVDTGLLTRDNNPDLLYGLSPRLGREERARYEQAALRRATGPGREPALCSRCDKVHSGRCRM